MPFGVFGSKKITCQQMRETGCSDINSKLLHSLQGMCDSLLETDPYDIDRVEHLRKLYFSHIEAWQEVLSEIRPISPEGLHWHFIDETKDMTFIAEDVANDCFHPSATGHANIARKILPAIKRFFN